MTSQYRIGLLDADVLIAAHRNYYAPDLCPGFWDCVTYHLMAGRLLVIDRVRDVCRHVGVNYQDTYAMLRNLGAHFDWERP